MLPLAEPVPLMPGIAALVQQVRQPETAAVPEPFLHFHGAAELVLITQGSGRLQCEGHDIPFAPGTVLYVPPMAIHDFAFAPGARSWTLVQFDPHALDPEALTPPPLAQGSTLDAEALGRVLMMTDWLAASLAGPAQPRAIVIQLQALMLLLAPVWTDRPGVAAGAGSALARFRPLLDRLGDNPAQSLTLGAAASLCTMSPSYFSRRFKQVFGTGFTAYQTRLKLQQAARMIATGSEPVSLIAFRLGFRSHAYFSHCFKAAFGVPPSRHRKPG